MSRTTLMITLTGLLLGATQVLAHPSQPPVEPPAGQDHGVYSVQDQAVGPTDPLKSIAYDNFSQSDPYHLTAIRWTGIYAEPFPASVSDTDFIVSIWGNDSGAPDLNNLIKTWTFEGGSEAGMGGPDLMVTANGDTNPHTATTEGGGAGFDYRAPIDYVLGAGQYWISVNADQLFSNADPIIDPEWQWHLGMGHGDGFYYSDGQTNTPLTNAGTDGKDLAFAFEGTLVPEPSGALLAMISLMVLGVIRRRR